MSKIKLYEILPGDFAFENKKNGIFSRSDRWWQVLSNKQSFKMEDNFEIKNIEDFNSLLLKATRWRQRSNV